MKVFMLVLLTALQAQQAMAFVPTNTDGKGPVVYYGGPVLANVKIYAIFWTSAVDKTTQSKIGPFYASLANSSYLDLLSQYSTKDQKIGRGSFVKAITITPKNPAKRLQQADVENELIGQMDSGAVPASDSNSLYMIHFPKGYVITAFGGDSCQIWCGDHEGIKNHPKYGNVAYAMLPDLGGACSFGCSQGSGGGFNSMTNVASHEIAEAITDPMSPGVNEPNAFPAGWIATSQNEIGDLCVEGVSKLQSGSTTYIVQNEWSNATNQCQAGPFTASKK